MHNGGRKSYYLEGKPLKLKQKAGTAHKKMEKEVSDEMRFKGLGRGV